MCSSDLAVGQVLMHRIPKLKKQLARHLGIDETVFVRWMLFLLALHDLGKFTDSFQKLRKDILMLLQERESNASGGVRHDILGYVLWREHLLPFLRELGVLSEKKSRIVSPDEAALDVWMSAVTGHHGVPPGGFTGYLPDFMNQADDVNAVKQFVEDIFILFMGDDIVLPEIDEDKVGNASWWMAGFIVLCDWLGSSRKSEDFHKIGRASCRERV